MEIFNSVRKWKRKGPGKKKRKFHHYAFDLKLRTVKLHLEEGVPVSLIEKETGVTRKTIWDWIKRYREKGEKGLQNARWLRRSQGNLPAAVKEKIVEVKKENPGFGVRRISQVLRRIFFLPASPETVRKTLHEQSLMDPPVRKSQRNPSHPRFFERATPNQMWQSDIFTFKLGNKYAYLIGYIDDYSRYITGMDLLRSQTGASVIEVYRRAVGEYGPPQEMLTDNGRQYATWRGTSRFQGELKKDRVKHIRSSPHHPMTLGKMERFWKSIFQEFLARAQFGSFEEAQERVKWWVRYYNHKRPHQGIGGLCPADRYFEIQSELKKTIEQGIQENVLEMALRGKPKSPFYMVGRMEGQSVVLRAEKGKLRLTVDGEDETKELIYNLEEKTDDKEKDHEREDPEDGENGEEGLEPGDIEGEAKEGQDCESARGGGEVPGGAFALGGAAASRGALPRVCDPVHAVEPLGEASPGGDASGPGTPGADGPGTIPEPQTAGLAGGEEPEDAPGQGLGAVGGTPVPAPGEEGTQGSREEALARKGGAVDLGEEEAGEGPGTGGGDHGRSERSDHGGGGGDPAGGVPEHVLQVGAEGPGGDDAVSDGRGARPSGGHSPGRPGEGPARTAGQDAREGAGNGQAVRLRASDAGRV